MLREVGESIMTTLKAKGFKQVEFYEGQFERFDEEVVYPPAAYIEYSSGVVAENNVDPLGKVTLTLHVLASRLERSPGNMLDLLEDIVDVLHNVGIRDTNNVYLGRCFVRGFKNTVVLDGLVAFEVELEVIRG